MSGRSQDDLAEAEARAGAVVTAHRAEDERAAARAKVEFARIEAGAASMRYAVSSRMVSDITYGTPANGVSSSASGGSR